MTASSFNEGEHARVAGILVDSETNLPLVGHRVVVRVDLNFDGVYSGHEITTVQSGINGTFHTLPFGLADDGESFDEDGSPGGNGTSSDQLTAEAVPVEHATSNQENEEGKQETTGMVNNVSPVLLPESITFSPAWDSLGIGFREVTITGQFTDPGVIDRHLLNVSAGAFEGVTDVEIVGRTFSVTLKKESQIVDYYRLFPIVVTVADDDQGNDTRSVSDSCETITDSSYTGINHTPGRGMFTLKGTQPGVEVRRSRGSSNGVPDTKIGVDAIHFWAADKPTFLGLGQCEIGIVQVAKTTVDYEGPLGVLPELVLNRGWHIDGPIPYANPFSDPTYDDPLSKGLLSAQDRPGIEGSVNGSALLYGIQEFETCVVAMPEGSEAVFGELYDVEYLQGMAIYGCVRWFSEVTRNDNGTYNQRYGVMGDVQESLRGEQNNPVATYSGEGIGPSDVFASLIRVYYAGADD